MRIKKFILILVSFVVLLGIFGCNKVSDSDSEYIYLPEIELRTSSNPSGFKGIYKDTYKYDSHGNVIKKQCYTKDLFYERDSCIDTTYTYDEDGKILKEHVKEEHFSTNLTDEHYTREKEYEYFYNEKGQLIKKDHNSDGFKYEYDDRGNCVKKTEYHSHGNAEEDINHEYIYAYDSENNLIKMKEMVNMSELNLYYVGFETDYIYDVSGKLLLNKTTSYNERGETIGNSECSYYYDDLNRLIKEEYISYDDYGLESRKEIKEYKDFVKVKVEK